MFSDVLWIFWFEHEQIETDSCTFCTAQPLCSTRQVGGCESSPGVVVPCREGSGGSWASWKLFMALRWVESANLNMLKADSSVETWSRWFLGNKSVPFHILFSILLVVLPTSLPLSSVDVPVDVEDGTCGVGSCSCGAWADMHCTRAASLNPYCLVAWRAQQCSAMLGKWEFDNLIGLFGWIWGMFNGCSLGCCWEFLHLAVSEMSWTVLDSGIRNDKCHVVDSSCHLPSLATPVIFTSSIFVRLSLRRVPRMLFATSRKSRMWFLDMSWCFLIPTWEFHRDSPSTHQRLTKARDAPLCSEDSSKASGAHGLLLFTACLGTEKYRKGVSLPYSMFHHDVSWWN